MTGPKTGLWPVRAVNLLLFGIGVTLIWVARRDLVTSEMSFLAAFSAAASAAVDVVFVARGALRRLYLVDAGAESLLIAAWVMAAG